MQVQSSGRTNNATCATLLSGALQSQKYKEGTTLVKKSAVDLVEDEDCETPAHLSDSLVRFNPQSPDRTRSMAELMDVLRTAHARLLMNRSHGQQSRGSHSQHHSEARHSELGDMAAAMHMPDNADSTESDDAC